MGERECDPPLHQFTAALCGKATPKNAVKAVLLSAFETFAEKPQYQSLLNQFLKLNVYSPEVIKEVMQWLASPEQLKHKFQRSHASFTDQLARKLLLHKRSACITESQLVVDLGYLSIHLNAEILVYEQETERFWQPINYSSFANFIRIYIQFDSDSVYRLKPRERVDAPVSSCWCPTSLEANVLELSYLALRNLEPTNQEAQTSILGELISEEKKQQSRQHRLNIISPDHTIPESRLKTFLLYRAED